jgi:hypothetical protein
MMLNKLYLILKNLIVLSLSQQKIKTLIVFFIVIIVNNMKGLGLVVLAEDTFLEKLEAIIAEAQEEKQEQEAMRQAALKDHEEITMEGHDEVTMEDHDDEVTMTIEDCEEVTMEDHGEVEVTMEDHGEVEVTMEDHYEGIFKDQEVVLKDQEVMLKDQEVMLKDQEVMLKDQVVLKDQEVMLKDQVVLKDQEVMLKDQVVLKDQEVILKDQVEDQEDQEARAKFYKKFKICILFTVGVALLIYISYKTNPGSPDDTLMEFIIADYSRYLRRRRN